MSGAPIVTRVGRPADVFGVHGAEGLSHWTCLARRAGLDGTWEAIEWASIPPGGVSGEHRHTRTEEIYYILTGRAEIGLNGRRTPVGPGDMALTAAGTSHSLHNTGGTPVNWLVIEMLTPATAAAVRWGEPARKGADMESTIVNLREQREIDPRSVFDGPLELIRIRRLAPGQSEGFDATAHEHTLFVLDGSGLGASGQVEVDLAAGTSVTLPLGGRITVTAGPGGLEFFHARMAVPGGRA
ncbi:hypothetical protein GCM10009799_02350 [Nocardiopsis rhodophaea]|uniref:Cupin type-2 domain-containing protein n=1 Tax=Nocardiopsis rhodophaea TaxID=280238 RepID=A0ABN2S5P3_9ACTN